MKIGETEHEVLEQLWIATEEQSQNGLVIHEKPPEGAQNLIKLALAKMDGNLLKPTPKGRNEAARAVRRHRLAERLLADVLVTEEELIHRQACRMEHALFDGLDDSICTLLGHPRFCPHGSPIPTGQCCRDMRKSVERLIAPLSELKAGQEGHIAYVHMNNAGHLQKLMAMGVLPGVRIKLLRQFPSVVFEAGNSQFAVDQDIAADVYVRLDR